MDELVSIIIPAYNAECWISNTILSALSQTWPKKEIIIVDDGSTDNTLTAARRFESEILKVVAQQNKGASAARNKGLRFAQGNYIQWLDADDILAPDKISHQLKRINRGRIAEYCSLQVSGHSFTVMKERMLALLPSGGIYHLWIGYSTRSMKMYG